MSDVETRTSQPDRNERPSSLFADGPRSHKVAALYVEKGGVYFGLADVDPWDEERDARLYAGPYPVVAHPPCNKWSPLAYINQRRLPDYRLGDDGGCFAAALTAVRTWGGVLEHPASSRAWAHHGIIAGSDQQLGAWIPAGSVGGWHACVCHVTQSAYGHRARKLTRLYYVGPSPNDLSRSDPEVDAIVSGFTHQEKGEHVACEHRRVRPKEASRTPVAFRDVLLDLARSCHKVEAVA